MRKKIFSILIICASMISLPILSAQAAATISDLGVDYFFGEQVSFHARLTADESISQALVILEQDYDTQTLIVPASITSLGEAGYDLLAVYYLDNQPLRAFSNISFIFEVTLTNGQVIRSSKQSFYYQDNRFAWQSIQDQQFQIYYTQNDRLLAQKVLDTAEAAIQRIQGILSLKTPEEVDIYVYPNSASLQAVLGDNSQVWVAGHADPDLGVVVVSLPAGPDQQLITEQRVPHELMHVMLYRTIGERYKYLPAWLNEGLATQAELYPNPEYQILLENAREHGNLLPISSLCAQFPQETSLALLAYAESASFIQYLLTSRGSSGIQALVEDFSDGLNCEKGVLRALGYSLDELDLSWRRDVLGDDFYSNAFLQLLPWLALLMIAVAIPLTIGVVSFRRR